MADADLTVVTIAYNDRDGLAKTLESVRSQVGVVIQHVVVDGGSTDGSVEVLYQTPGVEWTSERDNGRYDAMNKGLRRARAELVWWLHAGDTFRDERSAARAVAEYHARPFDWAYGLARLVDPAEGAVGILGAPRFRLRRFALGGRPIPHQAVLMRRKFAFELGGYDEQFGLAADQLFLLRAAARSLPRQLFDVLCDFDTSGAGSVRPLKAHYLDMARSRRMVPVTATGSPLIDWILSAALYATVSLGQRIRGLTN